MMSLAEVRATADVNASKARDRRAVRRAAGKCVNGSTPAVNGIRCVRCAMVHRFGVAVARKMNDYRNAPACNPRLADRVEAEQGTDLVAFMANFFGVYPTNVSPLASFDV